jgi:hypothetical protein
MFIKVNAETIRCVSFADGDKGGQQMAHWVPAGTWKVCGTETIQVSDRGSVSEAQAARLERGDLAVFVAPSAIADGTS